MPSRIRCQRERTGQTCFLLRYAVELSGRFYLEATDAVEPVLPLEHRLPATGAVAHVHDARELESDPRVSFFLSVLSLSRARMPKAERPSTLPSATSTASSSSSSFPTRTSASTSATARE